MATIFYNVIIWFITKSYRKTVHHAMLSAASFILYRLKLLVVWLDHTYGLTNTTKSCMGTHCDKISWTHWQPLPAARQACDWNSRLVMGSASNLSDYEGCSHLRQSWRWEGLNWQAPLCCHLLFWGRPVNPAKPQQDTYLLSMQKAFMLNRAWDKYRINVLHRAGTPRGFKDSLNREKFL